MTRPRLYLVEQPRDYAEPFVVVPSHNEGLVAYFSRRSETIGFCLACFAIVLLFGVVLEFAR